MVKKVTKKKEVEAVIEEQPIYNEYGVCINCQGGDPNCHHNNLIQGPEGVYCALCGFKV